MFRLIYPKNIYYLVKSFFSLILLSNKKQYDVLFYYPQHFNRGIGGSNPYFERMIKSCEESNLSYLLIEEPDYATSFPRNNYSVSFDFFWLMVLILRKVIPLKKNDFLNKERQIGKLLSLFFLRVKTKNIITISQSFQSIFRGVYPEANLFDYQHGLLSSGFVAYHEDNKVSQKLIFNKAQLLLNGVGVKNILKQVENGVYFNKIAHVIGGNFNYQNLHSFFNTKVLLTLQISVSHTVDENNKLLVGLLELCEQIKKQNSQITLYIKEHPRFNNCINLEHLYTYSFVEKAPDSLKECFSICSLHITEYSTTIFEAASYGVPTILSAFVPKFNFLEKEYFFPSVNGVLIKQIERYKDVGFYQLQLEKQVQWSQKYYEPFNEELFTSLMRK